MEFSLTTKSFVLVAVLGFIATVSAKPRYSPDLDDEWSTYKYEHDKTYHDYNHELNRRAIWEHNREKIIKHNIRYSMGKTSYFMGINQFTDMSCHDFSQAMTGFVMPYNETLSKLNFQTYRRPLSGFTEGTVDWRDKGLVTEVKDQGNCGSCWAFSVTGALEGQWARAGHKLVSLSEQNLLDCAKNAEPKGDGCKGGIVEQAYISIKSEGGIMSEADYPYETKQRKHCRCRYRGDKKAASLNGFEIIQEDCEDCLTDAIAQEGPISVGIAASCNFQHYKGGVFDDEACDSISMNHAMLAVGYGNENGKQYYIVKNSWGKNWGEQGYIRMSRNKDNQCSIASWATYPTV